MGCVGYCVCPIIATTTTEKVGTIQNQKKQDEVHKCISASNKTFNLYDIYYMSIFIVQI